MIAGIIVLALFVAGFGFVMNKILRAFGTIRGVQKRNATVRQNYRTRVREPMFTDIMRYHQAEIEAGHPVYRPMARKLLSTYWVDPETGIAGIDTLRAQEAAEAQAALVEEPW